MTEEKRKNQVREGLVAVLLLVYELFYFRKALDGHALFGLSGDSILVNMILEHWHDVFCGRESILTLPSFWPAEGSLGYSDALLGPGIVYSLLRIFIAEPFSAFNPALILTHLFGVITFYILLRKLGCGIPVSLAGLFMSFWSCSFTQLSYHTQFFALAFVPALYLCLLGWWRKRKEGGRMRLLFAFAATLLYGLLWLSTFYAAYFISLHLGLALLLLGGMYAGRDPEKWKRLLPWITEHLREIVVCALMQLLWILPFLKIYMAAYAEKKEYDYDFVFAHAPDVWDLLRTDSFGPVESVLREFLPAALPEQSLFLEANRRMETSSGWALVTFVFFMLALVSSIIKYRAGQGKEKERQGRAFAGGIVAAGSALLLVFLLTCRYGTFLPWALLRHVLPGADTIRVGGRCMGILAIPMAVVVSIWMQKEVQLMHTQLPQEARRGEYVLCVLVALALVWSGQARVHMNEEIDSTRARLEAVPAPPQDCRVVFLCPTDPEKYQTFSMNLLGWLIANRYGVKTINGYSGSYPAGWFLITEDIPGYYSSLQQWVADSGITDTTGIYGYIEESGTWISYEDIGFH